MTYPVCILHFEFCIQAAGFFSNLLLIVTTIVEDPEYLTSPFVTSSNFRKQADATGWKPTPCTAR